MKMEDNIESRMKRMKGLRKEKLKEEK